jgi:hypothetical protein
MLPSTICRAAGAAVTGTHACRYVGPNERAGQDVNLTFHCLVLGTNREQTNEKP